MHRHLVDTGALIALIDSNETWHADVKNAMATIRLPLIATQAVLTETFYFAQKIRGTEAIWTMVLDKTIVVAPIEEVELPALHTLMLRYADRPMDFADATLVHIAEREKISTILTIDHDDFETYRIGRNKRFRILPAR